ncbi:fimbria/pilus outer membrane usher protein [Novilysobacter spongiicola]|uniref:Outer membrane usher protein n=1 Tax=Lysobacter spongiicola DSM 21749 TaxID=1122188 RepID=A0A1T4RVR5_9GAMM|nr:fimbria/pilus outer membrane usher protein [Lysobacter spongiicola]SKA19977.1 outer membrane usher protein [Lysobacter spongiicola DSM 21749]
MRHSPRMLAAAIFVAVAFPAMASGPTGDPGRADAPEAARFNPAFLSGAAAGIDLTAFSRGNPVVAGMYRVDVYVNGRWTGRRDLEFKAGADGAAAACLTLPVLEELGVDSTAVLDVAADGEACRPLADWIPDAGARFDSADLRYDLEIPQAFMRRTPRGYVSPALWDPGISAGYLGYQFSAIDSRSRGEGAWRDHRTAYLGLNGGLNLAGWQLRHDASLSWSERDGSDWENIATYLRRPLPALRGVLTLGDAHTSGELFDSIAYRGASLVSDDRMLPDSLRGYAPVVRGIAETSAQVEIRQNGQLIHSVSVAPGSFVIDDLYPTGYGGDLEVTVVEADGRRRGFNVPYGSVAQMLRPGSSRYAITVGRARNPNLLDPPAVAQATYQRGIANRLTLYGGAAASEDYESVLYGAGVSTPAGAFAVDVTHARASLQEAESRSGRSIRVGYSNLVGATGTNIALAAYRYSTRDFLGLQDAILARDLVQRGVDSDQLLRQRSQFQLTLNQPLGPGRGALYLTGSVREFWGDRERARQFQFGYNNAWKRLNYGVSAVRSFEPGGEADTQYLLSFSVPLGRSVNPVSLTGDVGTGSDGRSSSRIGITGSAGPDYAFNYGVAVSESGQGGTSVSGTADYRTPVAALSGSYSHAADYRQATAGVSGTVVVHSGGATFAPQRGDTMVLVEAPGAEGARVQNAPGVRVDGNGFALVPYVSPYRLNTVTLDPYDMPHDIELQSTSATIAPYAGAISRLRFETRQGRALLIHASRPSGEPLPFGARVLDGDGQVLGMVGQGGLAYVRTEDNAGSLLVQWSDGDTGRCRIDYAVPERDGEVPVAFTRLEAACR